MQINGLKIVVLFCILIIPLIVVAQGMKPLVKKIDTATDPIKKVKYLNEFADTILWQGDGTNYEAVDYINQVFSICKNQNCGEAFHEAKIMETYIKVNAGEQQCIYDYALPTLRNHTFHNPTLKAFLHETCCLYYFFQGKLDSVKIHVEAAETILRQTAPNDKRMGAVYEYLGFYYSYASIHDTSLIYMQQAADLHLQRKDTLAFIKATKFLSSFYSIIGDRESALKHLLKAKDFIKQYPPARYYIHRINIGLADVQLDLKDYSKAAAAYEEGLQTLRTDKTLTDAEKAVSLWDFTLGIAISKLKHKKAEEALTYIIEAEEYCKEYDLAKIHKISTKLVESEVRVALKQYERANSLLEEVFLINDNSGTIDAYNIKIAKILTDIIFEGNFTPSKNLVNEMLPILNRIIENNKDDYNRETLQASKLRTLLHIYMDNRETAIEDFKNTMLQGDTLWSRSNAEAAKELLIAYETKEKDQLLAIQKLQLDKRNWQRGLLLALVGLLVVIVGFIYFNYHQKRRYAATLEQTVQERTEELHQSNKDLQQANKELTQANYELKAFNHIASHDIKEPIRNIGNYASFIQRKLPTDLQEDLDDYFETIRNGTTQLYTLVEDFAKYTSFSQEQGIEKKEKVDLNVLVNTVKETLYDTMITSKGKIINSGLPSISSSRSMLYVILKNLIDNGLKYNESKVPTVLLRYNELPHHHEIVVEDNGIGIKEAYHDRIFDMFKRLHNRDTYTGSGIGLSIVKLIIDKLNGTIELKSSQGEGSTFVVRLPKE